jgi:hypothetical protein
VYSVQGSTLIFRTDDGRNLTVDMSHLHGDVRPALIQRESITVVGVPGARANEFVAHYIQHDPMPAAPPGANPPQSQRDCRNGGWRNYGSRFENQGLCIDWVNLN